MELEHLRETEGIVTIATETTQDQGTQHLAETSIETRSITPAAREAALPEMKVLVGVGVLGVGMVLVGAVAFLFRVNLAELILGAHIWFTVPVTEGDALKVLFMTIQIVGVVAWGLFTAGVAFGYALVKWTRAQEDPTRQQS
jgi:hypothetical protein